MTDHLEAYEIIVKLVLHAQQQDLAYLAKCKPKSTAQLANRRHLISTVNTAVLKFGYDLKQWDVESLEAFSTCTVMLTDACIKLSHAVHALATQRKVDAVLEHTLKTQEPAGHA